MPPEEVRTPARIVLKDVPAPAPAPSESTLTVYRRGDILPSALAAGLPDDVLSRELLLGEGDTLFLIHDFDLKRVDVIRAGPPGEPRGPASFSRSDLDVYGQELNPGPRDAILLRRRGQLFVQA